MDFAQQQRNPSKHLVGMSIVVLLHVIIVYALVTGLARKMVEVIKQPLQTKLIEEIKKQPDDLPPPPPKLLPPPPPFVPPPEVQIQMPSTVSSGAITTTTSVKPVATAPVAAPKVAVRRGVAPVHRVNPVYPKNAARDNIEGVVEALLSTNGNGDVVRVTITKSIPRGVFDNEAIRAMMQWKFKGEGGDDVYAVEVEFKLAD